MGSVFHERCSRKLVIVAGSVGPSEPGSQSKPHGGFDNDPVTMDTVMQVILGDVPARLFTTQDLGFRAPAGG